MTVCHRCWIDAGHLADQEFITHYEAYERLLEERKDNPCPQHRGLHIDRTIGEFAQARRERALSTMWEQVNIPSPGVNNGRGVLEGILRFREEPFVPITQRDATVAATAIQWLGTNVGFSYLETALRDAGYKLVSVGEGKDKKPVKGHGE